MNGSLRDKMVRIDDLMGQIKTIKENYELKIADMFN
jgi:hypothetical protein